MLICTLDASNKVPRPRSRHFYYSAKTGANKTQHTLKVNRAGLLLKTSERTLHFTSVLLLGVVLVPNHSRQQHSQRPLISKPVMCVKMIQRITGTCSYTGVYAGRCVRSWSAVPDAPRAGNHQEHQTSFLIQRVRGVHFELPKIINFTSPVV